MKKISDEQECKTILNNIKPTHYISNVNADVRHFNEVIKHGHLYFINILGSYIFLEDRGSFYKTDYFLLTDEISNIVVPDLDKPMVTSLVTRRGDNISQKVEIIKNLGFKEYMKHIRMRLWEENYTEEKPVYIVKLAKLEMLKEIQDILLQQFDVYTEDIPNEKQIKDYIEKGNILVSVSEKNEITGIIVYTCMDDICEILFYTVKEEYRGKGISYSLWVAVKKMLLAKAKGYLLWVRKENKIAKNLYKKLGFKEDERIVLEFIKF